MRSREQILVVHLYTNTCALTPQILAHLGAQILEEIIRANLCTFSLLQMHPQHSYAGWESRRWKGSCRSKLFSSRVDFSFWLRCWDAWSWSSRNYWSIAQQLNTHMLLGVAQLPTPGNNLELVACIQYIDIWEIFLCLGFGSTKTLELDFALPGFWHTTPLDIKICP